MYWIGLRYVYVCSRLSVDNRYPIVQIYSVLPVTLKKEGEGVYPYVPVPEYSIR